MIGDYSLSNLANLMDGVCGPNGCDGGSPQDFPFNWTQSSGADLPATGTVTMTGSVDNDAAIEQGLLQTINTVLQKTSNCSQIATTFPHSNKNKRDNLPGTSYETITMSVDTHHDLRMQRD